MCFTQSIYIHREAAEKTGLPKMEIPNILKELETGGCA